MPREIVKRIAFILASLVITFHAVESSDAVAGEKGRNVLLLCIDDLRPELACFGKSYIHSPNIDQLASTGRIFRHHYVQAPTCGASRYVMLTGQYGSAGNDALFARAKKINGGSIPASMPEWFRNKGYTTVSVGKVSHHPGGRGGPDWNDQNQIEMPDAWTRHLHPSGAWQHPRGAMHGLAHGEIRANAKEMDLFQSVEGGDEIYPDGLTVEESLRQLDLLADDSEKPFFLAVGILKPHLPFGAPAQYMKPYLSVELPPIPHPDRPKGKTTWHGSGEFMKYNRWGRDPNQDAEFADAVRRHYAACVSYADAQVGRVLDRLDAHGLRDNTVIVLWGDHGWHLGEHAIWGKHALFEESLHSPLIISAKNLPQPGIHSDAIVETRSLFPTLCELTGISKPDQQLGASLNPILQEPTATGGVAISYTGRAQTIRDQQYRLIAHQDGAIELYDHRSEAGETQNVADQHPELVRQLMATLTDRLGGDH
ncbi:MAG: sulfatase [Rubripirellula sp.]|nr:sulfatase [Rubripirellula sp.]